MYIEPTSRKQDDPEFIRLIDRAINHLAAESTPEELYIVEIDRWFDHKWLRFSGIGVVKFDTLHDLGNYSDSALDEFSQQKITFPPFTPKRVRQERYLSRSDLGTYLEKPASRLIHKNQRSSNNLHRRVSDFSNSAIYVWYSSNTTQSARGSLMVYIARHTSVETWFASFTKRDGWSLDRVKGIDRGRLSEILSGGAQ